jgi:hypothetical protein
MVILTTQLNRLGSVDGKMDSNSAVASLRSGKTVAKGYRLFELHGSRKLLIQKIGNFNLSAV